MNIIIREATATDITSISDFQLAMAIETENKQLDQKTVLQGVQQVLQDKQCGFYLVCEINGQVVASLLVTHEWSDWRNCNIWYLQSVYVMESFRGQGIFKQMYREVFSRAQQAGSHCIRLYVDQDNARAQNVYQSLGMRPLSYLMYEADVDRDDR